MPCKIRHLFNEYVGQRVVFSSYGSTYSFSVRKGRTRTILYGRQWKKFIADREILSPGDLLMFSMRSRTINVAFVQKDESHEDSSSEESSSDDMNSSSADESDELDDDGIILIAQRADLTTHENNRIAQLVPATGDGPFVGLVTRLTSTNVGRHDMVRLPIRFHFHSCFPPPIFSLYPVLYI